MSQRARIRQVLDAYTAPLGKRIVITDLDDLVNALDDLFVSGFRELVADVCREQHPDD
jgi:hypothetical protein